MEHLLKRQRLYMKKDGLPLKGEVIGQGTFQFAGHPFQMVLKRSISSSAGHAPVVSQKP
ncbi:MAG: hypothetical protein SWE60_18660 [Thermodesulfobacteriota bacterium]|nr:hypothetical protein [Thermodesulfobacteriota bacterium]